MLARGSVADDSACTGYAGLQPVIGLPARSTRSWRISFSSLLFRAPIVNDNRSVKAVTVFRKMPVFFVSCVSMRSMHEVGVKQGYSTEIFGFRSSASNQK